MTVHTPHILFFPGLVSVIESQRRISTPRSTCAALIKKVQGLCTYTVAPVAYKVILEPGVGQFREFESPWVHTRINRRGLCLAHKLYTYKPEGTLSCAQIDLRETREREFATLDDNQRVGWPNPMPDKHSSKEPGRNWGEIGRHMWPRLVHKLERRSVEIY